MKYRIFSIITLLLTLTSFSFQSSANTPGPVVDHSTMLDMLDITATGELTVIHSQARVISAFLPKDASVNAVLLNAEGKVIYENRDTIVRPTGVAVFNELSMHHFRVNIADAGPGDYTFAILVNDEVIYDMPFNYRVEKEGDDFSPKLVHLIDASDWQSLATLRIPLAAHNKQDVVAKAWVTNGRVDANTSLSDLPKSYFEIYLNGDRVAGPNASTYKHKGGITHHDSFGSWTSISTEFNHPESKGGSTFKTSDLLATDGIYDLFQITDGQMSAGWQFEIKGGKPVMHPRQSSSYQPRKEYLIPRYYQAIRKNDSKGYDVVYMEKLSFEAAQARFNSGAVETAAIDDNTLANWQWQSSGDGTRPTELMMTDVQTRADTSIYAGDEIIVFGSGFPTGVQYLRVGDTSASDIPDGETYDAKNFQVCGKKIVLVKKKRVLIYDTDSDTLTEMPESEIYLKKDSGGNHTRNTLRCNGNLVATLNDVSKVTDKLMLKVIDLSGAEPAIIRIKNGEYKDSLVDSVAIDAAQGILAVSSSNKKLIATAPIADMAGQREYDLTDYEGISSREIHIVDGGLVYADKKNKMRFFSFDDETTRPMTDEPIGRSGNGYIADHGKLVISTEDKKGDRYQMAISNVPETPYVMDGTGDKIDGTSGQLGMAGQAAITPDGSVFVAGTPRGGIGTGEHLQVLQSGSETWQPIYNEDSEVFGAIDVVASQRLVAFKYGGRKESRLGYITFGDAPNISEMLSAADSSKAEAEQAAQQAAADAEAQKQADEAAQANMAASQKDMAFLAAYMDSETQMAQSFVAAFGEEEGKKKAREMTLNVMKNNGHGHLVEMYEQMMN